MFKNTFSFLLFLLVIVSCKQKEYKKEYSQITTINWNKAKEYYVTNISNAEVLLDSLDGLSVDNPNIETLFFEVRKAFKKAEPFAGSLNADVTHRANGPALPVYKEDSNSFIEPIGLQKLEETIFSDTISSKELKRDIFFLKGLFKNLKENIKAKDLDARRFFVGTYEQLMRIVSFSTVGFDTPVTGHSVSETKFLLQSLYDVYALSIQPLIKSENKDLDSTFKENIDKAIAFVGANPDFATFDRYTYIRDYLNPITRNWVTIRKTSNLWDGNVDNYPFNFDAPTFFETNSFNVDYFLDVNFRNATKEKIALGEKLFFENKLSADGKMACVTCHLPNKGYTDGLTLGKSNTKEDLERNSPTLLNSIYQKAFFWDGRSGTIQAQINNVFNNKKEFNVKGHKISDDILNDSAYVKLFKDNFAKAPNKRDAIHAISVYVSSLSSLDSKFDKNIRGEAQTFTAEEQLGFNLFAGKALCATCHFLPLTNGSVPPFFKETEKEVIGVPNAKDNKYIDDDRGFYWVYEEDEHDGMFKTPTIRNIEKTGPYMHNGVYTTLEEVMDFYNKGGGAGLGFDLPHQTLPFDNLELSESEISAVIAFMKTLTDEVY